MTVSLPVTAMQSDVADRILENLATAVLAFDRGLRLKHINPAAEALLQLSAKQVLARRLVELLPHNDELVEMLKRSLADRTPFTAHGIQLVIPDKQTITVDCTATPFAHADYGIDLLVELAQVDWILRIAHEEQVAERQSATRALIQGLAHEIKNPLGGLRGAAQLLESELLTDALKEYTRIIIHEADRLRSLVDRMIGPDRPLQQVSTNLHEILEHVCDLIRAEHPSGIRIEREYDPSLPTVKADSERLTQALLNIIKNAVEAMEGHGCLRLRTGIERQFTIGQERHRLVLRVNVEDNGPGISEELLERIFYPMVTNKPEGTGLGLCIAQDVIARHGGLIECSSRPQKTVFTIYLPLEHANG
ncbi:MAG: nitrogen regulation protein NR(II) [Acidiferrobacterales bacterium]